jgi:serine/threonine protein kinase
MSPEQAVADEIGPPSDVFSLGAVLTFAATGEGPFGTGSIASMIYRVVHVSPDTANLPARIRPVIERCLAKDPGQRPTPGDLLAELGAGELAIDWLPPRLTEVVSRYAAPGMAAAASLGTGSPLPAGVPDGATPPVSIPAAPPTTTGVSTPTPPSRPADPTQPAAAADASGTGGSGIGIGTAGPSQRSSRRRMAWVAGAAVVIVAASASTALAVSSHGGQRRGTTGPSQGPSVSAPATAHPTRSSSPTVSPSAASTSFAQSQPTARQYTPTPTPTTSPTPTTTATTTPTPTTTPTSSPTPTTTTSLPTSSPSP